ncbi:uncharacterized protein LOC114732362 isoform X1 [Neltuma alba]|uniref:uncharacterized protein LOC114732362 isoform X1 n=1 Tax=Neltuma alba TaxID=207710 RepID=UPI0010A31757|nr:uncharacterized protein LOC114732362 isoform X1 [Prosopis alba]
MGKIQQQNLQQRQSHDPEDPASSGLLCRGCSVVLQRFANEFSFKCLFVLILSLSALVSGVFWVYPRFAIKTRYDASDAIKQSATVQASFKLEKPVSQLIPYIKRLEYDIYSEIGVPNTEVAILSIHKSGTPNFANVTFGVLSKPLNVPINSVYLSLLRSSLVELFLKQSNLTLTTSIFGNASMFEIATVPGGISVIPVQLGPIIQMPEILFNFTLNSSINEILDGFDDFKNELRLDLDLRSDENVYVQLSNEIGSTVAPPVTVQVSVTSTFGVIPPQRYLELARIISGFTEKNLGRGNSNFGKVKEVRLSSYFKGMFHGEAPSSAPAPSPQPVDAAEPSISPYHSPSHLPVSPTSANRSPCFDCQASSPAPSIETGHPPDPCPYSGFSYPPRSSPKSYSNPSFKSAAPPPSDFVNPTSGISPDQAPITHGSRPGLGKEKAVEPINRSLASLSSSSACGDSLGEILILVFYMLSVYCLFCLSP